VRLPKRYRLPRSPIHEAYRCRVAKLPEDTRLEVKALLSFRPRVVARLDESHVDPIEKCCAEADAESHEQDQEALSRVGRVVVRVEQRETHDARAEPQRDLVPPIEKK
jgi:hypothetical protein